MSYVLTLVASDPNTPVSKTHLKETEKIMDFYNVQPTCAPVWLSKGKAVDLGISDKAPSALLAHLRSEYDGDRIDVFMTDIEGRQKKLLLADMDSTIVSSETLDELADFAGIKDQISEITKQAMEGLLDFPSALRERVGLLRDLPVSALQETLERIVPNPGAETLVKTMKKHGASCVLVSGGFTFFTQAIAEKLGFDAHEGNQLEIHDDKLTGKVIAPILDKDSKVKFLNHYSQDHDLSAEDCLTIGDGANDVPMLKAAGLGIGYKPKEVVANAVTNLIVHGDLTTALYAQGYTDTHFA